MDESQAIKSLSKELEGRDTAIYCFQPPGTPQNFIAETVITGAAVVLITAFFNGLESTLKPGLVNWGAAVGTWLSKRLGSLFEAKAADKDELTSVVGRVRTLIAQASPKQRDQVAAEVEKVLEGALHGGGALDSDATAIAALTRQSAMAIAT